MATATVKKAFPRRRGEQLIYLLKKDGPQTIWELYAKLRRRGEYSDYSSLRRSLNLLREKGLVGVVNYKEEDKRLKRFDRYAWNFNTGRHQTRDDVGTVIGGKEEQDVWAAVINSSE